IGIYGAASSVNHMAPWGGSEPLLGTNPIAVAIPAGDEPPVVLDIATSLASNGAIRTYELEGKSMPEGWVQHRKDGSAISDPQRIEEGTDLPMGGYKGSGLSLVIGLLAGPLNGAAFGRDIRDFAAPASGTGNVGQFVIAFDVARFVPLDAFKAEISRHVRDLVSSHRLPDHDEIRAPGMGRAARRAERERNGVPLSAAVLAQIDELATSLDIAPLSARMTASSASPFWRFSLRFYRQDGVADACITLQEEAGVDVNLLLFLLWHATRKRTLSASEITELERRIAPWRDMTVVPLRAMR